MIIFAYNIYIYIINMFLYNCKRSETSEVNGIPMSVYNIYLSACESGLGGSHNAQT